MFGLDPLDKSKSLVNIKVREVRFKSQCIDHHSLNTCKFLNLGVVYCFEVGEVRKVSYAVARNLESLRVPTLDGGDIDTLDVKILAMTNFVQHNLGYASILLSIESVVKIFAHTLQSAVCSVDINRSNNGVVNKIECSNIVNATNMILVLVG